MSGRQKLLLLIPAILLIPILLGMTPLNMAIDWQAGVHLLTPSKAAGIIIVLFIPLPLITTLQWGILRTSPLVQESLPVQEFEISLLESVHSNINLNSTHLRC